MYIEAELDEIHSERLTQLQHSWQKPISEILATLIDLAIAQQTANSSQLPKAISIGQWPDLNLSRDSLYDDNGR